MSTLWKMLELNSWYVVLERIYFLFHCTQTSLYEYWTAGVDSSCGFVVAGIEIYLGNIFGRKPLTTLHI